MNDINRTPDFEDLPPKDEPSDQPKPAAKAPAAFQQRVFPTRVDGVRAQIVPKIGAVVTPQAEIDLQVATLLLL